MAGYMMRDAVTLHDAAAHASGAGLALLAREEIGRFVILVDLWKRSNPGEQITTALVRKACEDHVAKQRRGQLSIVYRAAACSGLARILKQLIPLLPSSGPARKLRVLLEDVDRRVMKRTPDARHAARMRALYVDLNEAGTDWNRPATLQLAEAAVYIDDAVDDYSVQRDRLTTAGILRLADPVLAIALDGWADKPPLPDVVRRQALRS